MADEFYADNYDYAPQAQNVLGVVKMKFRVGDDVEVVGNLAGHNQVGQEFEVQGYVNNLVRLIGSQYNFYEQDLKLLPLNKEKLQKRCQESKDNYYLLQSKIDYLEANNLEKVDDAAFRKYQMKKLIENENLSSEDKSDRIAALFVD